MKYLNIFLTLIGFFFFTIANAQNLVKYIPFKHENKWGIVDSSKVEIVSPIYKDINIFDDFRYAEFDGKIVYDLKNGTSFPALGKYKSTVMIEGEEYHLFTNTKRSTLINFQTNEIIKLSLRYDFMKNYDFYDTNSENPKIINTLIFADLINDDVLLLRNNKGLNAFIPQKFSSRFIEMIIKQQEQMIGFAVGIGQDIYFYDSNLDLIKKIKSTKKDSYGLDLWQEKIKISELYNDEQAKFGCFKCESPWFDAWALKEKVPSPYNDVDQGENLSYFIKNKDGNYFIFKKDDQNFKLEVQLKYFYFPEKYKTIIMPKTNSLFFYDEKYMRTEQIMFPEKYFKQQTQTKIK